MFDMLHVATVGLWPLVWHYSAATIVVAACLAVFIFSAALAAEVPLIQPFLGVIRRWALVVAVIVAAGTFCYAVGVSNGESHIQAKWDAAEAAAVKKGTAARKDAVRAVDKLPAGRVRNDPYDRDNH
jgi:hypothetical protein